MNQTHSTPVLRRTHAVGRRHLLFGAAVGLPLALLGCGGGDAETLEEKLDAFAQQFPLGPADGEALVSTGVEVSLPAALVGAGTLWVATTSDEQPIAAGRASVLASAGGADLAAVFADDDTLLALGWIGEGNPPISLRTTASVLVYLAAHLGAMKGSVTAALRASLASWAPADTLAVALADLLAADRRALHEGTSALQTAIAAALDRLAEPATSSRERPQTVVASPTGEVSGIELQQADGLDSVQFQSNWLRRAVAFVNREGYEKRLDDGSYAFTSNPQAGAAVEIPLPKTADTFSGTIEGAIEEYTAGSAGTAGSFFRSVSERVTLESPPDGFDRVRYRAIVVAVGAVELFDKATFAKLDANQQSYLVGSDFTRNINLKFVFEDVLAPWLMDLLFAGLKLRGTEIQGLLQSIAKDVFEFCRKDLPGEIEKLFAGTLSPVAFVKLVNGKFGIDPNTGKLSEFAQDLLKLALAGAAALLKGPAVRDAAKGIGWAFSDSGVGLGASQSRPAALRRWAAGVPVFNILQAVDIGLRGLNTARVFFDAGRGLPVFGFEILSTRTRVTLTPSQTRIQPTGRVDLTANVVGAEDPNALYTFVFTAQGGPGRLIGDAANGKSVTQSHPRITYYADTTNADSPPETVEVQAYAGSLNSPSRRLIGKATATISLIKPYNIQVTPDSAKLRPNGTLTLQAGITEPLPEGSQVEYSWSTSGGQADASDQSETPRNQSQARFTAPDAEGAVTVRVTAVVTAGGTGLVFRPDPIDVPIEVTRTAKTISFRVRTDSIVDTRTNLDGSPYCNVTHVTFVPEVGGAVRYETRQTGCTDPYGCSYLNRSWTPTSHYDIGKRGGMWYFGMGGDSGGCDDVAVRVAAGKARYASAVVTCTVTLAD